MKTDNSERQPGWRADSGSLWFNTEAFHSTSSYTGLDVKLEEDLIKNKHTNSVSVLYVSVISWDL